MKQYGLAVILAVLCVAISACHGKPDGTTAGTIPSSQPVATTTLPVPTSQPTLPTTLPPTVPTTVPTQPPIPTGWQQINGKTYYFRMDGTVVTGWLKQGQQHYYFGVDGAMVTGWLSRPEGSYYLDENGVMLTGWQELDGKRYFLGDNGVMATGWLQQDGREYYLREDGAMAQGHVRIGDRDHYFTSQGQPVLLVNPWNFVPEGYDAALVTIRRFGAYTDMLVAEECYEPLMQMLSDCKSAGHKTYIVSAYRSQQDQEKNYQRKVNEYLSKGYSEAEARVLAAKVVAVPGTSEHQLGLALDIVDASWPYLKNEQANMPAQKWLMEHSWEYGFILRYPADKTDVTGIIYEPWHYRYVGKELAAELHACGLTLEEYLANLTQP